MAYKEEIFNFDEDGRGQYQLYRICEKQKEPHCHDCLELNLVQKGSGTYIIGGKMYPMEPGDIFVINNREHHLAIHGEDGLTLLVLIIETGSVLKSRYGNEYLKPFLNRSQNFSNRITGAAADYRQMAELFALMEKEETKGGIGWQMVMETAAHLLLALLYQYYNEKNEIAPENEVSHEFGRLSGVFQYVNEHFAEEITLEELARQAMMSRSYLCRYFKNLTGMTVFEYLEQIRIQYAGYLLKTTQAPVAQVAMDSGFSSVSYFNRLFRKSLGVTPLQYRRGETKRCLTP